jgi:hypothetical protein
MIKVKLSSKSPWRPIGLWDVEAPTFSRQSAHRLVVRLSALRVCRPLPSGRFLVLISVNDWTGPRAVARMEGKIQWHRESNPRTSACSIVPQPTTLPLSSFVSTTRGRNKNTFVSAKHSACFEGNIVFQSCIHVLKLQRSVKTICWYICSVIGYNSGSSIMYIICYVWYFAFPEVYAIFSLFRELTAFLIQAIKCHYTLYSWI